MQRRQATAAMAMLRALPIEAARGKREALLGREMDDVASFRTAS